MGRIGDRIREAFQSVGEVVKDKFKEVASEIKEGYQKIGEGIAKAGKFVYQFTPMATVQNFVKAVKEGDWKGALKELAIGAVSVVGAGAVAGVAVKVGAKVVDGVVEKGLKLGDDAVAKVGKSGPSTKGEKVMNESDEVDSPNGGSKDDKKDKKDKKDTDDGASKFRFNPSAMVKNIEVPDVVPSRSSAPSII